MALSKDAQLFVEKRYSQRLRDIEDQQKKKRESLFMGKIHRWDAEPHIGKYALIDEEMESNRKKAQAKRVVLVEAYKLDQIELSEVVLDEIMREIGRLLGSLNEYALIEEKKYLDDLKRQSRINDAEHEERLHEVSKRVTESWTKIQEPIRNDLELKMAEMRLEKKRSQISSDSRSDEDPAKARRVWVVYGRDERLRSGMFTFLRALGLEPVEFLEARKFTGDPSPYVGEILEAAFERAQAVVVLLTPDDEARLRPDLQRPTDPPYEKSLMGQARPNVLFEAGMAFMSHPGRTVIVQIGEVRPFSDIAGKHIIYMDGSTEKRQELANRLIDAKCLVKLTGTDWHTSGDLKT